MKYNRLGTSGLFVSELSLGAMTFGVNESYPTLGGLDQPQATELVARALDAGVNLFDTADIYALGQSERLLGEALRGLGVPRERYLIASKAFGPMGAGPNEAGASRAHVHDAVRQSLRRLGVDHIDLYQIHGFDPATPVEETLRALDDLVRQGHVRYVGVSNWAAWQIAKALGVSARLGLARFDSLQAYYSVAGRDLERELVPLLESEGVGLLVWSPLAGGLLSGKQARGGEAPAGSRRSTLSIPPVDEARAHDAIDVMRGIAEAHGASVAQIALAWLLHQKAVSSVIVGAKRMDQLDDNLGAVDVALDAGELDAIDAVSRLPTEYPGWMFDLWSERRRQQLAGSKR
ncbi:aldo/keto reductase [Burkholderia plantarii]|uniref:Putative aldo/keto reductase n=1 Tax=Burkholderia plantarii TaxID=41899 RepID=A0A0B6S8Y4_BURPL|nr:aldo/keto reductase [Burkholderia plantarii]AJK50854.1 putative aldo/keto reductase [Burkholderia plantarii]